MIPAHDYSSPSLLAVRAFEAAARRRSFTLAADELGLTQSAISRHVRRLEDLFGLRLFERRGRHVDLTPAGQRYFEAVTEGLGRVRAATRDMMVRARRPEMVTVSLLPSLAALWLAPRLARFTAEHPNLELCIRASRQLADPVLDGVDVAIRYGRGVWPGWDARPFAQETVAPICSPDFAKRHDLGSDPRQLLRFTLLCDDIPDDWRAWFSAAGLSAEGLKLGPCMDESATLYQSVADGAGVSLGRSMLVDRLVAEGRLTRPFALRTPATYAYWIVTPSGVEPRLGTRQLLRWLESQRPSVHGEDQIDA